MAASIHETLRRQPERLVQKNFSPNALQELAAVRKAFPQPDPEYPNPNNRIKMTLLERLTWESRRRDSKTIWDNTSALVMDHSNHLNEHGKRVARIDDGTQDFSDGIFSPSLLYGEYPRDSRGVPLHPEYRRMLTEGAVAGLGRYWEYGPNHLARAVVLGRDDNNKIHVLVYEKGGITMLPGGNVDKGEDIIRAAQRETKEETGISKFTHAEKIRTTSLAPNRATLNAWEETTSVLVDLEDPNINKHPIISENGIQAQWMALNIGTLDKLFLPHANDVRLAILKYEKIHGEEISSDGSIIKLPMRFMA